ncbi:hypothetical protein ACWCXX_27925 [Streptomyces sp. NPDC001732]
MCAPEDAPDVPGRLTAAGRLAELFPRGHTATVPLAVHDPGAEDPARFSAEPMSFLETV